MMYTRILQKASAAFHWVCRCPAAKNTCFKEENIEEDPGEQIRDLILMEFAGMITPEEQQKLDMLVAEDPEIRALRAEIQIKLSDPRCAFLIKTMSNFSLADVKEKIKRQRRRQVREKISAIAALITKQFFRIIAFARL